MNPLTGHHWQDTNEVIAILEWRQLNYPPVLTFYPCIRLALTLSLVKSLSFRELIQSVSFLRCHSTRLICKEFQDLTLLTFRAGSVLQMGSTQLWRLSCTTSPLCNMMLPATGSPRTLGGCRICQPPLSRQVQVCSILVIMTRVGILTAGPSDIFQTGISAHLWSPKAFWKDVCVRVHTALLLYLLSVGDFNPKHTN